MNASLTVEPQKIVLVFQGGGALGAYQAGVFEALDRSGQDPDWVIGTSIGAINSALIAGNPPQRRLSHLSEFWRRMGDDTLADAPVAPWSALSQALNVAAIMTGGLKHFFRPRLSPGFAWGLDVPAGEVSYYDTAPLRDTLEELVDFTYLKRSPVRLSVGAVDIESGQMRYFDSHKETIGPEHIMASGALPPAFPPVEIGGRFYWDGGIHSNTPLEYLMQDYPRFHSLCIVANLWQDADQLPTSLAAVQRRVKELQFASRTDTLARMEAELHRLRHSLCVLEEHLKPDALEHEDVRRAADMGCLSVFHMIRLQAPRLEGENQYKDIEFSPDRVFERWGAGYTAAKRALSECRWKHPITPHDGVVLHDYAIDATAGPHEPRDRQGEPCAYKARRPAR